MQLSLIFIGIGLFSTIEARPSHNEGGKGEGTINVDGEDVGGKIHVKGDGDLERHVHVIGEGDLVPHIHEGDLEPHIHVHRLPTTYVTHTHRFVVEPQPGDLDVSKNVGSLKNGGEDINLHTKDLPGDFDGITNVGGVTNGKVDLNKAATVKDNRRCDGLVPDIANKVKSDAIAFDNRLGGLADKLTGEGGLLNDAAKGIIDAKKDVDRGAIYAVNDAGCGLADIVDDAAALLDGKANPVSAASEVLRDFAGGIGYIGEDAAGQVAEGLGDAAVDVAHKR